MDNFEVKKVFKRLDKRYITVEFKTSGEKGLDVEDASSVLNLRVYRYKLQDGSEGVDPQWGFTELELPFSDEYVSSKLNLTGVPDNIASYEVGIVREGLRWIYREWVEE